MITFTCDRCGYSVNMPVEGLSCYDSNAYIVKPDNGGRKFHEFRSHGVSFLLCATCMDTWPDVVQAAIRATATDFIENYKESK